MTRNLKNTLQSKSRAKKRLILVAFDALIIPIVLFLCFSLRFQEFYTPTENNGWLIFPLATLIALPIFLKLGLYRAVLQHFRSQSILTIIGATLLSTVVWVGIINLLHLAEIPASVALLYWLATSTLIIVTRLIAQNWLYGPLSKSTIGKKVFIYGAGLAGSQLAKVIESDPKYSLLGFIDDDPNLKGMNILGSKVYSSLQFDELSDKNSIDEIILAMPSIGRKKRQSILKRLENLPIVLRSVPSFSDLASGKLSTSDIKEIDIDDLLGRQVIKPDESLLPANIKDKTVMVTGAGGSIGSELCRQIISLSPKKLILLEQSEFALYQIEQELEEVLAKNNLSIKVDKVLGSITNPILLKQLFNNKSVQTIYHAAAYKHVPLVEGNPVAGLSNNIFGTQLLAQHALDADVETFILISTDKAVRPTNVMGCSKRVAELVLQAFADQENCKTVFSMVRFGNVLGSSGSVVPKFRQQIKEGGPITVTDKEITRFFMSIPEAVQLVIQAGAMAKGGEVFVLDMGESVKIVDLAKKMISLAGLSIKDDQNPEGDIEIEYSGLRPGEKLYEELLIGDNVSKTQHKRIMQANEVFIEKAKLNSHLDSLQKTMLNAGASDIRKELAVFVDGYKPWKETAP